MAKQNENETIAPIEEVIAPVDAVFAPESATADGAKAGELEITWPARSEVNPKGLVVHQGNTSWFRDDFGLLHYVCECGLAVPLSAHSADLSGRITPEVDCGNLACGGPRLIILAGFNGGA